MSNIVILYLCFATFYQCTGQTLQKPQIGYLHVMSDIRFRFATTLVTSEVANPANTSQEVRFDVTLPNEAFISDFQMEIGGKIYPGEVNEKVAAQKKYDAAKKKGQSAGQVKQKPRNTNRFSVEVNVGAQEKVFFNLTYQELLKRKRGSYEHVIYINPKQIVADFQIHVSIEESRELTGVRVPPIRNELEQNLEIKGDNTLAVVSRQTTKSARISYSPSEADQRQDSERGISGLFIVEYDIDRETNAGDVMVVDGYFVHFFAPSDMEEIPKDVLLILDVSGSMYGTKLKQMKDAVLGILSDLHEGDRFNILKFSSSLSFYKKSSVIANKKTVREAKIYVKNMVAAGGTDINSALMDGSFFLNKAENFTERAQVIFFLTDGEPTSGETNLNKILENVRFANWHAFPIYSLAFGQGADYNFIKKVAIQNNGLSRKIYEDSDATLQIKGFYDEVSAAVLKDVSFKYLNNASSVQNLTKISFPSYLLGSEIVVAGKIENNDVKVLDLSVEGLGSQGTVELSLSADLDDNSFPELTKPGDYVKITEKIWAYLTIKQLLEKSVGETDPTVKEDIKKQALELSLKYKFVTPLTSMVVVKPEKKETSSVDEEDDAVADSKPPNPLPVKPPTQGGSLPLSFNRGPPGTSYGGGAGGDPHFMIRIRGMEYPLCFDLHANPGDVLRILANKESGIFINAGIVPSFKFDAHHRMKTFMGEIVILFKSHVMKVTPTKIVFDGAELFWGDENPYFLKDVTVEVVTIKRCRVLRIDFGNSVQVAIKRTIAYGNMAVDYLNVYIENEAGLSENSSGILGQFLHRHVTVHQRGTNRKNQIVGDILIEEAGMATKHVRSFLKEKPDEVTGNLELCWNAHNSITKTAKSVQHFFVDDIMEM